MTLLSMTIASTGVNPWSAGQSKKVVSAGFELVASVCSILVSVGFEPVKLVICRFQSYGIVVFLTP